MTQYYESKTLIEFVKQNTPNFDGETTMECVERAIREAPSAWINVKDEKPKEDGWYIVTLNNHSTDFCRFSVERDSFGIENYPDWNSADDEVTHWMQMPEPAK